MDNQQTSPHKTQDNIRCPSWQSQSSSVEERKLSSCSESSLSSQSRFSSRCFSTSSSIKNFLKIDSIKEEKLKSTMNHTFDLTLDIDDESEGSDIDYEEDYEVDLPLDSSSRWLTNEVLPVRDHSPYAPASSIESETVSMRENAYAPRRIQDVQSPTQLSKTLRNRLRVELFCRSGDVSPMPKLRDLIEIQNYLLREDSFDRINKNRRTVKTFQHETKEATIESSINKREGKFDSPVRVQDVTWQRPHSIPNLEEKMKEPSSFAAAKCA